MFWGPPETCSAKIWSQASGDDEFDRGYVTADYHWICEQCFADFRKKFNWNFVAWADDMPNDDPDTWITDASLHAPQFEVGGVIHVTPETD